ncbi:MAG: coiled-coil domain-containing 149 family protein [Planctomycetota bacterium]
MGRRNHKSIICIFLSGFWMLLSCLWVTGCTDNPDAKAAKEMRNQTAEAVQASVTEKDYDAAQQKVMASLQKNRPQGLTKDAALLASGNLAMVKGQQMQADVAPLAVQLRTSANHLEKILRDSEKFLLEKERNEMLLAVEDQESTELQKLLSGDDETEGLNSQLEQVDAQSQQLLSQKTSMQAEREQIQAVLDDYQGNADLLLRQAELAKGAARLDLEKQALALLQERKDHYLKAQTLENKMAVLDGDIALVQVRFDGLTQNIQDVQQRIEAIDTSPTRTALKQQMREIEDALNGNQQRLGTVSGKIAGEFAAYRKASEQACAVYEEALAEFEKIRSGDASFAATVRSADSAHHIAVARSTVISVYKDLSERLQGLLDTADPVFISAMQSKLPLQQDRVYKKKAFESFDQSIEIYEKAISQAGRMGADARCSLLKSKLLALYGKMQLADLTGEFTLADSTETAMNDLIQTGTELGTCFTQSETMRVVTNEGLDYLPSLPLNMDVFIDGKKQELSEWKQLPVSEQEPVVDNNLQQIDELVAQHGQDVAQELEPLKLEMLAAKEGGFKETQVAKDPNFTESGPL